MSGSSTTGASGTRRRTVKSTGKGEILRAFRDSVSELGVSLGAEVIKKTMSRGEEVRIDQLLSGTRFFVDIISREEVGPSDRWSISVKSKENKDWLCSLAPVILVLVDRFTGKNETLL